MAELIAAYTDAFSVEFTAAFSAVEVAFLHECNCPHLHQQIQLI